MKKRTQIKQQVRECISSGLNKPPEIAEQLGYKPSYIRQVIGIMVRENELERVTVNGKSMIGFGLGQRLHDPFNLCKEPVNASKGGFGDRFVHFLEAPSRGEYVGAGSGKVLAKHSEDAMSA